VAIRELEELRTDLVIARIDRMTRGKGSGLSFESRVNILFGLQGGRITRLECYSDDEDARRRVAELVP